LHEIEPRIPMSMRLRSRKWPGQVAAVALGILILAVSFCLFHDAVCDMDQHAVARDLCGGLLVSSSLTVTLLALAVLSRIQVDSLRPVHVVSPRRIDPPPKSAFPSR
jgi:hypothetical protein